MNKLFLLPICTLILSFNISFGQTAEERAQIISQYDLQKLSELEQKFDEKFNTERAEALRLAIIYGWPEEIKMPNGGAAILVGIFDDLTPKYYETHNKGAGITTRTNLVHTGGSSGLDLNGENMIGGVWDGGKIRSSHILLENRVTQMDASPTLSDHATHVSGTMIGTGDVVAGNAKGMAPEALLWGYDFLNDEAEMTSAAGNGLLVSNHSYGLQIDQLPLWRLGYYDERARNLDNIVFNAPHYLPVVSAGNDRQSGKNTEDGGFDYLTDKGVSKNSVVVAAVFQVSNYSGPESVAMSPFSSWGPTDDGRIKPDISGKGVNTYSSTAWTNTSFDRYDGTSMAAPNISGSLLLLQQHHNTINGSYMLASTLKGLALHTADEAGISPGPDYKFGWGLMNTSKAVDVITNNGETSVIIEEVLALNEVYTFSVQANGVEDLVASITWTDPAGVSPQQGINDLNTSMLVNDLDLRISDDGGATFFPWKLNPLTPVAPAIQGDNTVDNIEKIEISNAVGEYVIRVSHKNTLRTGSQAFSLIVTGINREDFSVATHDGYKEVCPIQETVSFDIDLNFSEGFTDTVNFSVSELPAGAIATLTPNSRSTEGTVTLNISNLSNTALGRYELKVTAAGTSESINVYPILNILNPQLPAVDLISPLNGDVDLPITVNFDWQEAGEQTAEYDFQLSLDASFTELVSDVTLEENQITISNLLPETQYFWRVKATNLCGDGDYSEVYIFTTGILVGINDNLIDGLVIYPNPAKSSINIEANSLLDSVEVINILGQKLIQQIGKTSKINLNTSHLSSGTYLLRIISENKVTLKRFVKL